ncbi:hypothetical protein WJX84_002136 [Apatococcus fuscideae]|uniref:UspA domain-containing protein n=1 Tax=Apatococcus fuscideae TaxID=2026836 RepID=A0AAW1SMW7_9CHLO
MSGPALNPPIPQEPFSTSDTSDLSSSDIERRLLLAVDDSEASEQATAWMVQQLYRRGDELHLLHVASQPTDKHVFMGMYVPPDDGAEEQEIQHGWQICRRRILGQLQSAQIPYEVHILTSGQDCSNLAQIIAQKASDLKAACIVLARHDKSSLQELWQGSVPATTLQLTNIPAFIIPAADAHAHSC